MSSSASNRNDGLRRPERPRAKREKQPESETHVQCRICRGWYQAITYTHLKYKHHIDDPKDYKAEYALATITAPEVRRRIADQKLLVDRHAISYIRRSWGKQSLKEITAYLGINASTVRTHAQQLGLGLLVEKWTLKKVLRRLREARRSGIPLNSGEARKRVGQLYRAAIKYCRTWMKALERAGIPYDKVARRAPFEAWTREKIVSEIQELHQQSKDLDYAYLQARHSKLYAAARNHFENWRSARLAAGLPDPGATR